MIISIKNVFAAEGRINANGQHSSWLPGFLNAHEVWAIITVASAQQL